MDAGRIISGDAQGFYDVVRSKIGSWGLLPSSEYINEVDSSIKPAPPLDNIFSGLDAPFIDSTPQYTKVSNTKTGELVEPQNRFPPVEGAGSDE
jgi:hypothetical protein